MKQIFLLLTSVWLLGWLPATLNAQQAGVEKLTTREGLSQGYISEILQDREGFVWIGTKNGLNRYDGYRFKVFNHDPYDEHTLSEDFICSIAEYGDFLLVGTASNGFNLFHKKTQRVYRIPNKLLLPNFSHGATRGMWAVVDPDANLWLELAISANNNYLVKVQWPTGFWENPLAFPDALQQLKIEVYPRQPQGMVGISPDIKNLYLASRDTLYQINVHSMQENVLYGLSPTISKHLYADKQGRVWILTKDNERSAHLYQFNPEVPGSLKPMATPEDYFYIRHFTNDWIWLALFKEVCAYHLDEKGSFDPLHPVIPPISVPVGNASSMTDHSGIIWVGTNGLGIIKVNPRSQRFQHLFPGQSICGAILQDRQGHIYTSNNFPIRLHSAELAQEPNSPIGALLKNTFFSTRMLESTPGNFWVAGVLNNSRTLFLKKIDANGQIKTYNAAIDYTNILYLALALDQNKDPWIAAQGYLIHFNPNTEQFQQFDFNQVLPDASNIMALARSSDGCWWIALEKGLIQAKPNGAGFDFKAFVNNPESRNSLRNNMVSSLLTDPSDPSILWIGTKGGGLNRLDTRTLQFTQLTTQNGLPNDVIYGVLADQAGNLWMSSNKGLIRYTPATGLIKNYTEEDGVQANEFNTWAYGKGPDGTLMFGGVNGLTVFNPKQLQEDTVAPRTVLTSLLLNDREVSQNDSTGILTQTIEFTREIEVPFAQNNITIEFSALHFAASTKNRFRYYLDGAEKEWAHESTEHSATYLNLSPGDYVFRVKSANSEGVWSAQITELKITVLPPWYRAWWAWMSYILLLTGSAYAFYQYQLKTKLEHSENERLKELDSFKSRFFTNITHEFRTPLTVILGMAEQTKKHFAARAEEAHTRSVEMIQRNGKNLLQLINQILDLSKLESGKLQLQLEKSDMIAFARYIVESFHSYAAARKVQMHFLAETEALIMDFDREKIQAILSNLCSNAIKFTPAGGHVYVHIGQIMDNGKACCQIKVRDTGIGIPADKIGQIFERFYQVDNASTGAGEGSGIGLALTKELVRLMQGDISAISPGTGGSTFTVKLPITTLSEQATSTSPGPLWQPQPATKAQRPAQTFGNAEKPLLLVVEDNEDVRQYLMDCVAEYYQIAEAQNGQIGIEKALELVPDLIVSDVMMPEKDGLELCQTLKNDERTSHIPIVLLTAKADVKSRIEGLSRGADEYVAKPFEREELLARLRNLLENRRRLQSRYATLPLPAASEDPELKLEDAFLLKIRNVVEANLSDADFEMPQLERALGMSRSQIFRKVKALTDQSPSLFIRSIRLHKAKDLLRNTQLTVAEIAYEVGFTTPSYFSTSFLEEFGKNPSDFRQG